MRRCYNKNEKNYERYGARGIAVCAEWHDYVNFKRDMAPTFQPGLSIERKDNDGNYESGNCCWATRKEQCRNRRSSCFIEFRGEKRTAIEWGDVLGIPWARFHKRIFKMGWPVDRAMTEPPRPWSPGNKRLDQIS